MSHRKTLHEVKAYTCGSIASYILKRRPMLQYVFSEGYIRGGDKILKLPAKPLISFGETF